MLQQLLHTVPDYIIAVLRIVSGIIIFPYGMQKVFGWFGGHGIQGTLAQMRQRQIPLVVTWLIILGQSLGSIALITGFAGRVAAAGNFIIFTGAMITHLPGGWMMNWFNKKEGEGIEYFIMLLTLLLAVIVRGSGALSVDMLFRSR